MSDRLANETALSGMTWKDEVVVIARRAAGHGPGCGRSGAASGRDGTGKTVDNNRERGIVASISSIGKFLRRPTMFGVLQGIILFACIAGVREMGILQPLELEAYDLFLRLHESRPVADPRVAQISITEADIQRLGRWPLPDEALAEMLEVLQSYRPEVIGIDIYRDLPVPPGSPWLKATLAESDNIYAVEKIGANGGVGVPPPAVLQDTGRVGFSDLLLDADGVVRRGMLFLDDGVNVFYSLSLRLALHYLKSRGIQPQAGDPDPSHLRLGDVTFRPFESSDGGYVGADAGGYQFLMDYRGGPRPYAAFSLGELLSGDIPREALEGRVVIIGIAADSVKDDFITPHRNTGNGLPGVPGVTIHAHATDQLLRAALDGDRPLAVLGDHMEYAWILLWSVAGVVLVLRFRAASRFVPVALGGTVLLLLISWLAWRAGIWLPPVPALIGWVATAALMTAYLTSYENAKRREVMELFSRQVSEDVAREIWEQREHFMEGGRVAAREVICTVLFSDLENFTPVSERLGARRLMEWLNRYMDTMAGLVIEYGGIVDVYYGDAIMADFGVPLLRTSEVEYDRDARNAVDCALAMREAIARLNLENARQDLPPVRMRVGIATGEMVVGFLGTSQRMKYTTIGDTVNTAARLESYGKELPPMEPVEGACRILVAESTARRLGNDYRVASVGALSLKGKRETVNVYKVLSREG